LTQLTLIGKYIVSNNPDSYDDGYRQALLDVAKLIANVPIPEMADTTNMQDFWKLLRQAQGTDTNKFNIFSAGFRVARREISSHIARLAKQI